jgi:DNA topoisomerase-6 subunit B
VISRTGPRKEAHAFELRIDTQRNKPEVLVDETVEWEDRKHGTRVEIVYRPPDGREIIHERGTETMPEPSREIKPHPHGVELGVLMKMIQTTKAKQLRSFLHGDFSRVSPRLATEICDKAGLSEKMWVSRVEREEADRLYRAIGDTKLRSPPTNCVSPIGEDVLEAGLRKECEADFYAAASRPPAVYRGNPFLVEAALAWGGSLSADEPIQMMRFANRVPLLYQQGACAITKAVSGTSWKAYGLNQPRGSMPQGAVLLVVHVASVWVPFTSESKEAIAHYPELLKEVRLAVQACGRKLGRFLSKRRRAADDERKRGYIEKYIPHIALALREILDLKETDEERTVENLRGILERSRS